MNSFIDITQLESFDKSLFLNNKHFPWYNFNKLLHPQAFDALLADFPSLNMFEKHEGIMRKTGQRPHNRYYLAYESSIYHKDSKEGTIKHEELPLVWQQFIEELANNQTYLSFMKDVLGIDEFDIRYAWHMGVTHSEVSPHNESREKAGTHIFYFNTSEDWNKDWGGEILVLGDKKIRADNPDFSNFGEIIHSEILDNHSFLFKNQPSAWHGVKTLTSPEGHYRRLFNVIFEIPEHRRKKSLLKKIFGQ